MVNGIPVQPPYAQMSGIFFLLKRPMGRALSVGVVGDRMQQRRHHGLIPNKRLISTVAIIFGLACAALTAEPTPLATLKAIHALTNADAGKHLPVEFEATVSYFRGYENLMFVEDEGLPIYVRIASNLALASGDRVLIRGTTQGSFRPIVIADSVTLVRHGTPPTPEPATFEELIRAQHDSMRVTVHAVVRAADLVVSATAPMQQAGVVLYVSSLADIEVLKRAGANPWSLPVTPMDRVLVDYHMRDLTPRIRVQGIITYYEPGAAIVLEDGSKSLWIETNTRDPLQIGDQADAIGFPDAHNRLLTLTDGEIQDSHIFRPITPQSETWRQLGFWSTNKPDGHQNDLVSIEGQVVTQVREASQDEYVLDSDGRLFTAIYRHPRATGAVSPMVQIPLGSKVRVTGICTVENAKTINPGEEVPFNILLRSFDDLTVIARPSWLNVSNMIRVAIALVLIVIAVGIWGVTLNRKVRSQTTALAKRIESEAAFERRVAQLEHKRSRILEDINGSRPLAEILEEIMELVSFALNDAPCWCEVTHGARLGDFQTLAEGLRVVRADIDARSGPPLGALFAALDSAALPATPEEFVHENEALTVGAKLASLAIETRRLYSDLLHRSEFDQLTDIHNRFSLGKRLGEQIEEARLNAGIFGLVYIDLDGFKQVNDIYGHHIGDLCLQEVVQRMKQQLRSHDLLARLGGDEFAVLLPKVPNRAGVEEIVQRLEHAFDSPLMLEGHMLQSSASFGIALYPEDGATEDSLLNTADTAMYAAKNSRKLGAGKTAESTSAEPATESRT